MHRILFAVVLLAAPAAQAQQPGEIDLDAVERMLVECRATSKEKALAERLESYGVAKAPGELDEGVGIAVSKAIEPAHNPEKAAEALGDLVEANASDPRYRLAAAYYMLNDMALYMTASCKAIWREYQRIIVFDDMLATAEKGDELDSYYRGAANMSRKKLAIRLRARRRLAEKEAALVEVLGLEGG